MMTAGMDHGAGLGGEIHLARWLKEEYLYEIFERTWFYKTK